MQNVETIDAASPAKSSALSTVRAFARAWLTGRRGLIIVGLAVIAAGLALGWNWLSAIGAAPIILSLAPCVAMCALGLCMNKAMSCQSGTSGRSGSPAATPRADADPS